METRLEFSSALTRRGFRLTYISRLNDEFNIVTRTQFNRAFGFGEMKENLFDHIGTFDETKRFLHRANNPTVLDWMHRILQTNVARAQITALIGGHLEAHLIAGTQNDIPFDVVLGVRQKEAFSTIFVANSTGCCFTGTSIAFDLGGHGAGNTFFRQNHLRRYLCHLAGNRFARATIVSHLEFDGIADFQVLNVAAELREMEKQTGLPLATLYEAIRVLLEMVERKICTEKKNTRKNESKKIAEVSIATVVERKVIAIYRVRNSTYQQLFDDTSFTSGLVRLIAIPRSSIVVINVIDVIARIVERWRTSSIDAVHQIGCSGRIEVIGGWKWLLRCGRRLLLSRLLNRERSNWEIAR